MKKYTYLFILLFVGTNLLGQSKKIDIIQKEFNQAYDAFFDKDEKEFNKHLKRAWKKSARIDDQQGFALHEAFKGLYVGFYKQKYHTADSLFSIALELMDSTTSDVILTYYHIIKAKENYYYNNKEVEKYHLLKGIEYVYDWHFLISYYSLIIDNCYKEKDYECVREYTYDIESYCESNKLYEKFHDWDWYYFAWIQRRMGEVLAKNNNESMNQSIEYLKTAAINFNSTKYYNDALWTYSKLTDHTKKNDSILLSSQYCDAFLDTKYANQHSQYSKVLFNKGNNFIGLKEYRKCISWNQKAVNLLANNSRNNYRSEDSLQLGYLYCDIAWAFKELQQYDSALTYISLVTPIVQQLGNNYLKQQYYNYIGNIHNKMGQYNQAQIYFDSTLAISKKLNSYELLGFTYNNFAWTYEQKNNLDSALYYQKEALNAYYKSEIPNRVYNQIFSIEKFHEKSNELDSVINYHNKAISYAYQRGDNIKALELEVRMLYYLVKNRNYEDLYNLSHLLVKDYKNLVQVDSSDRNQFNLNMVYIRLGEYFYNKSDGIDSSKYYYNKAYDFFLKKKNYGIIIQSLGGLINLSMEVSNYEDIIKYGEIYIECIDNLSKSKLDSIGSLTFAMADAYQQIGDIDKSIYYSRLPSTQSYMNQCPQCLDINSLIKYSQYGCDSLMLFKKKMMENLDFIRHHLTDKNYAKLKKSIDFEYEYLHNAFCSNNTHRAKKYLLQAIQYRTIGSNIADENNTDYLYQYLANLYIKTEKIDSAIQCYKHLYKNTKLHAFRTESNFRLFISIANSLTYYLNHVGNKEQALFYYNDIIDYCSANRRFVDELKFRMYRVNSLLSADNKKKEQYFQELIKRIDEILNDENLILDEEVALQDIKVSLLVSLNKHEEAEVLISSIASKYELNLRTKINQQLIEFEKGYKLRNEVASNLPDTYISVATNIEREHYRNFIQGTESIIEEVRQTNDINIIWNLEQRLAYAYFKTKKLNDSKSIKYMNLLVKFWGDYIPILPDMEFVNYIHLGKLYHDTKIEIDYLKAALSRINYISDSDSNPYIPQLFRRLSEITNSKEKIEYLKKAVDYYQSTNRDLEEYLNHKYNLISSRIAVADYENNEILINELNLFIDEVEQQTTLKSDFPELIILKEISKLYQEEIQKGEEQMKEIENLNKQLKVIIHKRDDAINEKNVLLDELSKSRDSVTVVLIEQTKLSDSLEAVVTALNTSNQKLNIANVRLKWLSSILISLLVVLIFLLRRTQQQKKIIEEQQKEFSHRIKNNLQALQAYINSQSRKVKDTITKKQLKRVGEIVLSMGNIHRFLYNQNDPVSVNSKSFIDGLANLALEPYGYLENIKLDVNEVISKRLPTQKVFYVGLIINELITNACKYAFNGIDNPKLTIKFSEISPNKYKMIFADNGIGLPTDWQQRSKHSMGMKIIRTNVKQLWGKITPRFDKEGAFFEILLDFNKKN